MSDEIDELNRRNEELNEAVHQSVRVYLRNLMIDLECRLKPILMLNNLSDEDIRESNRKYIKGLVKPRRNKR